MKILNKGGKHSPGRTGKIFRRKLSATEKLVLLIPAAAALIAVAVILLTMKTGTGYEFEKPGKQYYAGSAATVPAGTKLEVDENGTVRFAGQEEPASGLPVYLDDSQEIVLTGDMIYYVPRTLGFGRAVATSQVLLKDHTVTFTREGSSAQPGTGFLFDGRDFYLFLEPMKIQFMGFTMDLPALSYAEVINGGHIMLFNYETKECYLEPQLQGTVYAHAAYEDYVVSLVGDSMTDYQGRQILLATRPVIFDPIV